jgi:hypothetical protein
MNDEQYAQQYGIRPQVNRFESPESISKHIFEVENSPANAFNKDTSRANLEMPELNSVKTNISLIALISRTTRVMLSKAKTPEEKIEIVEKMEMLTDYFRDEQSGTTVPSRSKRGYAIYMSKTDRNIQQQDMATYGMQQQESFGEPQQPQGIGEKIRGAIPFLKKKEL